MSVYLFIKRITFALAFIAISVLLSSCGSTQELIDSELTAEKRFNIAYKNYQEGDYLEAETDFRAIIGTFPLSPYASESQLLLADTLYSMQEYEDAASYYTTFMTLNPSHQRADYALFQKAMCHVKNMRSIERDQKETRKAIFAFKDLINFYKNSKYAPKAKEMIVYLDGKLAEREFHIGYFYFKEKNYNGALARFRNVLRDYSNAPVVDKTLYFITESYLKLGEIALAKDAFKTLKNSFPDSPYVDKVSRRARES